VGRTGALAARPDPWSGGPIFVSSGSPASMAGANSFTIVSGASGPPWRSAHSGAALAMSTWRRSTRCSAGMADDRRRIAWSLSEAAKALPPAERRAFRKFLFSLDGAEPKRQKVHSWKRKKGPKVVKAKRPKRSSRRARDPQISLPLD
jgi:hypothetical protein